MGEWKPIESAPKDGSSFLGFVPLAAGYRVVSLRWAEDKRWRADVHSFVQFSPTHWQPLLAPPSAGMGERDVPRCFVTGNPVGTDTVATGAPCLCPSCLEWLKDSLGDPLPAPPSQEEG